jgi:hypothetical protein
VTEDSQEESEEEPQPLVSRITIQIEYRFAQWSLSNQINLSGLSRESNPPIKLSEIITGT